MATISIGKVKEINAKCSNGFEFDIGAFAYHGDKEVCKYIELGDGKKLKAQIYFGDVRVGYSFKPTIKLHLSLWEPCDYDSDMMLSRGLGYTTQLTEPYERKKFADVIEKTKEFDDAKILEIAKKHDMELHKECLVG